MRVAQNARREDGPFLVVRAANLEGVAIFVPPRLRLVGTGQGRREVPEEKAGA